MPPARPLRVGLVGAGRRGAALARAAGPPAAVLAGVADAEPGRAAALAAAHGAEPFASTPALLAASDAVLVAVPAHDRALVARAALAAGAHVFLAWPPAVGPAEAAALAAAAEEAGVEVGVARPLPAAPLLAALPEGWAARLVALDLVAGADEEAADPLARRPWPHRLAGALDLCAALARSRDVLRVEAEAERGPGRTLRAVAFALRFRNGAYAHAAVAESPSPPALPERLRLFAAGGGTRVEARGWGGPLCVEGAPAAQNRPPAPAVEPPAAPAHDPDADAATLEAADFLAALAAGRPAPFSIHDALDTLRLAERLMERLR